MATLKEIYNELEMIMGDVEAYVEEADNANLASDVAGNVKNPLEKNIKRARWHNGRRERRSV
jgi:hypothetical protein